MKHLKTKILNTGVWVIQYLDTSTNRVVILVQPSLKSIGMAVFFNPLEGLNNPNKL